MNDFLKCLINPYYLVMDAIDEFTAGNYGAGAGRVFLAGVLVFGYWKLLQSITKGKLFGKKVF
jgi:hypothetical protein